MESSQQKQPGRRTRRRVKWARPWFPHWNEKKGGCTEDTALVYDGKNYDGNSDLPAVDSPEFWKLVPEDVRYAFCIGYVCGKDSVRVRWDNRRCVMRIWAALLNAGYSLWFQTPVCFNADPFHLTRVLLDLGIVDPVHELTSEMLERLAVLDKRSKISLFTCFKLPCFILHPVDIWLNESAWYTEFGKKYVRSLRDSQARWIRQGVIKDDDDGGYTPVGSDDERAILVDGGDDDVVLLPTAAATAAAAPTAVSSSVATAAPASGTTTTTTTTTTSVPDDDSGICVICMDALADTIVHPCLHCEVCRACSIRLRDTVDAKVCVRCRRKIDYIDE